MSDDERERLLSLLDVHGQQFLGSFDLPPVYKKRKINYTHEPIDTCPSPSGSAEEEWNGFGGSNSDEEEPFSEEWNSDSENPGCPSSSSYTPDLIVFSDKSKPDAPIAKASRKSFMSSKVANITRPESHRASSSNVNQALEDDQTNAQNDVLLYRLLHTKLLSGSLNPDLNLTHAQREKSLSGRVLELSGETKLGKGENTLRQKEHNKASKHVREGLERKKVEREKKQLVEAKNLGNYHPVLKRTYASSSSSAPKRKRERGLGMGVGKFEDGILKLSRREIHSVTMTGKNSRTKNAQHRRR